MSYRFLISLLLACTCQVSFGHARGEDYVFTNFRENSIDGFFEINAFDLEKKFQIDIQSEGVDALALLKENAPLIQDYIRKNFSIGPDGKRTYPITFTVTDHRPPPAIPSGKFFFEIKTGPQPGQVHVRHNMFYETDPLHRGLLVVRYNHKTRRNYGDEHTALVFNPLKKKQKLVLTDIPSPPSIKKVPSFGFQHTIINFDHLLQAALLTLAVTVLFSAKEKLPVKRLWLFLFGLLILTTFIFVYGNWLGTRIFVKKIARLDSSLLTLFSGLTLLTSFFLLLKFNFRPRNLLLLLSGTSAALGILHGINISGSFGPLSVRMVRMKLLATEFSKGMALSCLLTGLLALLLGFLAVKIVRNPPKAHFTISLILLSATCYWLILNQMPIF